MEIFIYNTIHGGFRPVRMYGVNENGKTVSILIDNFILNVYLELPDVIKIYHNKECVENTILKWEDRKLLIKSIMDNAFEKYKTATKSTYNCSFNYTLVRKRKMYNSNLEFYDEEKCTLFNNTEKLINSYFILIY